MTVHLLKKNYHGLCSHHPNLTCLSCRSLGQLDEAQMMSHLKQSFSYQQKTNAWKRINCVWSWLIMRPRNGNSEIGGCTFPSPPNAGHLARKKGKWLSIFGFMNEMNVLSYWNHVSYFHTVVFASCLHVIATWNQKNTIYTQLLLSIQCLTSPPSDSVTCFCISAYCSAPEMWPDPSVWQPCQWACGQSDRGVRLSGADPLTGKLLSLDVGQREEQTQVLSSPSTALKFCSLIHQIWCPSI